MTPSQQHRVRPPPRTLRIFFRPRGDRVAAPRLLHLASRPRRQVRTLAAQRRNHPCNLLGSAFRQAIFCRLWVFESRPKLPRIRVTVSSNSRADDECRACATRMRRFPASSPRSPRLLVLGDELPERPPVAAAPSNDHSLATLFFVLRIAPHGARASREAAPQGRCTLLSSNPMRTTSLRPPHECCARRAPLLLPRAQGCDSPPVTQKNLQKGRSQN